MSAYLELHDREQVQWGRVRRYGGSPSGVVVIHTAESALDVLGEDTGAEGVASWIGRRNPSTEGFGSYHRIVDSDSWVQLVPWASEAWHDTSTNSHSVGISAAMRAADWPRLLRDDPDRARRIVANMAQGARAFAADQERAGRPVPPARMITRAQAIARVPGFVAHGTMDPGRRSDPGAAFPWDLFLALYAGTETMEDDMQLDDKLPLVNAKGEPTQAGRILGQRYIDAGGITVDGALEQGVIGAHYARKAAAEVAALREAVKALTTGVGIDWDRLDTVVREAVADTVEAGLDADVTITPRPRTEPTPPA